MPDAENRETLWMISKEPEQQSYFVLLAVPAVSDIVPLLFLLFLCFLLAVLLIVSVLPLAVF